MNVRSISEFINRPFEQLLIDENIHMIVLRSFSGRRILGLTTFCLLFLGASAGTSGRDGDTLRHPSFVEIGFRPAYLLPTNPYFRGEGGREKPFAATLSTHLKYGFGFSPESFYGQRYPYAVQGIGVAFNTFFNTSKIGNPIAVYVFQTSRVATLAENLSLDYEWNFGLSAGWNPYNPATNPDNIVVGSKGNAYINLGMLLNWRVGTDFNLKAGAGVTHFSNGNTRYPNAGVNTAGGNVELAWNFGSRSTGANTSRDIRFNPYVSYDLVLYGAQKKKGFLWKDGSAVIIPGSFGVAGVNFSPMYNFNKYFRAGLSFDAQFDESANITDYVASTDIPTDNVKFHRPPFKEQFAAGVSARAEIVMPIFSINIGVGRNILCKGADTDSFYQVFALKTSLASNVFIHTGYQLYRFRDPNNLMIGLGYRFKARR